jgi:hypothetical protein|tara:strand:- start:95 stop:907 length:813 start_codon:yes stop_codon:yes gene_type:complete
VCHRFLIHPIERLRYVARAGGVDQTLLAREAADAVSSLWVEPAELVNACRRIVHHHPYAGAIWALVLRVLISPDPLETAGRFADLLAVDLTSKKVASSLSENTILSLIGWPDIAGRKLSQRPDISVRVSDAYGEGSGYARKLMSHGVQVTESPLTAIGQACATSDVVLIEATAAGSKGIVTASSALGGASTAKSFGVDVWVMVGEGRALPGSIFELTKRRLQSEDTLQADEEYTLLNLADAIIGPNGLSQSGLPMRADCPVASELLRSAL